jgi:hypothetical protein
MSKTVDELMKLAADLAKAQSMKDRPNVKYFVDPTRAPAERLRSALEAVVAEAKRIEIDGHTIAPADVLRRIIRNMKPKRGHPMWSTVSEATAHGSTVSAGLCRWAGVAPDTGAAMQQAPEQEG